MKQLEIERRKEWKMVERGKGGEKEKMEEGSKREGRKGEGNKGEEIKGEGRREEGRREEGREDRKNGGKEEGSQGIREEEEKEANINMVVLRFFLFFLHKIPN